LPKRDALFAEAAGREVLFSSQVSRVEKPKKALFAEVRSTSRQP